MISFEEVYAAHQHHVFNLCLHYLQNRQEAEEAAQDVFVKIYHKLTGFKGESTVKTWVYRVTVNHCVDVLRARKRQKRLSLFSNLFRGAAETPLDMPDFDHPGVQLEDRESLEILFQKINALPENQKTALILRYLDHLSPPEIAEIMGVSRKAVEALLQRGKQNLQEKLR